MIMKIGISLLGLFLLACSSLHAAEEVADNEALAKNLKVKMGSASKVVVKHVPNAAIGNRLWRRENILEDWKYKIVLNCPTDCGRRGGSYLLELGRKAVRQKNECPMPLNTAVVLLNEKEVITTIYVDQSGHCLIIDGESYYSKLKFSPLSDFVKF